MPMRTPEQQREYQRAWIANRRASFFSDKTCVACGSTDELELDHIDPDAKVAHSIWSWSKTRQDAEIAKCQVLCKTCHWKKTKIDRDFRLKHGTDTAYVRYGCRCTLCKNAHAATARVQRARMDSTVQ